MPPRGRTRLSLFVRDEDDIQLLIVTRDPGERLAELVYVLLTVVWGVKKLWQMHGCSSSLTVAGSWTAATAAHEDTHLDGGESGPRDSGLLACAAGGLPAVAESLRAGLPV